MSEFIPPFRLTEQDKGTAVWMKLKAELERRLRMHRDANDRHMPDTETAALRGRIEELKSLLALERGEPTISEE